MCNKCYLVIPSLIHFYLWHTGLGTLGMVGEGGEWGQHAPISFAQEWFFN